MMMYYLDKHDMTPFRIEQWEEREMTDRELEAISEEHLRNAVRCRRYWAIKKLPRRSSRYARKVVAAEKESLSEVQPKYEWTKFIINLMQIKTDAQSRQETLTWSCNFTRIYNDYLRNKSDIQNSDCSSCMSFDKYVYLKISSSFDWFMCNNDPHLMGKKNWCEAWKRIMVESKRYIAFVDVDVPKEYRFNIPSKSYIQDVEILMKYVSSKMGLAECHNTSDSSYIMKLPYDPYGLPKSDSALDVALCHLSGFIVSIFTSDCHKYFLKY